MFINRNCFNWECEVVMWKYGDAESAARSYEFWRHAKNRLAGCPSEYDRVDCIGGLKRSIDHRMKLIQTNYRFDLLPNFQGPEKKLQKLQDYGLVRKAVLRELIEVRNKVEHDLNSIPEVERCNIYVDVVWYFLKSTDVLFVDRIPCDLCYSNDDLESITLEVKGFWDFKLNGVVGKNVLSETYQENSIALKDFKTISHKRKGDRIEFNAGVDLSAKSTFSILVRSYFAVSGYWYEDHVS